MKSILMISHGSQSPNAKREVHELMGKLKTRLSISIFECAFLEIEEPNITEGIQLCANKGATEIVILLNFLNSGKHVDVDIPRIIHDNEMTHPNIKFILTKPLNQQDQIVDLFTCIINES